LKVVSLDERGEQSRITGGRVGRVAPLVGMAGRTAGEAVAASLRKRRHPAADLTEFHTQQAQRYAEKLGRSRGVLMKAGQMMSLIGLDPAVDAPYRGIYQAAFARLQDDAPPMPPELAAQVVTAELGASPEKVFAEFDPTPLAAASIGQVHAARLHDGRRVAVKVQYPGVEQAIRADLANTELLATFLRLVFTVMPGLSRMDVREIAREVADRIGDEVDYRVEAANQQEFADLYRGHPFIRVPEIVPELSTRRVLTMELSDGVRYAKALAAEQSLRDRWGEAVYRFFSRNLVLHGLFNADPHPGNYLFHPDGSVTFLDFGCVKRFTPQQVVNMDEIVRSIVARDADRLMAVARTAGFFDPKDPPAAGDLLAAMVASRPDLLAPEPFTYTPESSAEALRSLMSPRGPHGAVIRKLSGAADYVFITRVDTGMTAVLGGFRATGPWRAIRQEYSDGAPPATTYGELDLAHRTALR
jgi:predicted unusual protein kinase regulating ubiquinone biosynthesis (AarF/ABC1/UbiB family)